MTIEMQCNYARLRHARFNLSGNPLESSIRIQNSFIKEVESQLGPKWFFMIFGYVNTKYCLILPLGYNFGDGYGRQAVFTALRCTRSLLARLGSDFLVTMNAKDCYTEVKSESRPAEPLMNILVSGFFFINSARGLRLALGVAHPPAFLTFPEGGKPSLWLRSLHEVSWPG